MQLVPKTGSSIPVSLLVWSFFSFSVLVLGDLFSLPRVLIITLFNILAIGYIFYFSFQHDCFPSANAFGFSMIAFHILIFCYGYGYEKIIVLLPHTSLSYKTFFYFITNIFVAPIVYWILLYNTQAAIRKIK